MDAALERELRSFLGAFLSLRRRQRMEEVLALRTRFLTVLVEDLYQPHNAAAVLRSCECFGVQDAYVVEGRNEFRISRTVDVGASRWLTLYRYGSAGEALEALKARGYLLAAATPHGDACAVDELSVERPLALLFGTEEVGLTEQVMEAAEERFKVPMYGFTESFNISVCAALALQALTARLRAAPVEWQLDEAEKETLRLGWYRQAVRGAALLEKRFLAERGLLRGRN